MPVARRTDSLSVNTPEKSNLPPNKSDRPLDDIYEVPFEEDLSVAGRKAPPRWDGATLRNKTSLLVLVSTTAGISVGIAEAKLGFQTWPLFIGLAVITAVLIIFGRSWVVSPVDRLINSLYEVYANPSPTSVKDLPTERKDEVGRIAKIAHRIAAKGIRDHHQSVQLRRTLSTRIESATKRACNKLENLAQRDPLTDLANRRCLDEQLPIMTAAALATKTDLVALMIDMDNFKHINDQLGHDTGDTLLTLLSSIIRGSIRHDDLPIRLGGDEFLLLMPGCPLHRAEQFADHARTLFLQQTRITLPAGAPQPNLSIGIASLFTDNCETGSNLVKLADTRLYEAKDAGKGCTKSTSQDTTQSIESNQRIEDASVDIDPESHQAA
ncbi:GGDEF domain-containing protein [Poriferisphaera sp. WC338]|uniref:GGDEF domain-containing protein n=1 Tax=Poriferisphaera sp. WC338 TaxID=3425129 RepID=UPI003D815F4A